MPPCCQPAAAPPLLPPSLNPDFLLNGASPLCSTSFRLNGPLEAQSVEIVSLQRLRNSKVFKVACAPHEWKPTAALLLQTPAHRQSTRASSPSVVDRFCPYRQRAHKAPPNHRRATPGHGPYMNPDAASNRAPSSRPWAPSPSASPASETASPWGPAITNETTVGNSQPADEECDSGQSSLLTSRLPDGQTRYGLSG